MKFLALLFSLTVIVLAGAYVSIPDVPMHKFTMAFLALVAAIFGAAFSAGALLKSQFTRRSKSLKYVQL